MPPQGLCSLCGTTGDGHRPFVNLHHEQFVIRQGELGQHEYTPHRGFPVHRYQAVVCPYRFYEVLLHGRALGYFLVHHFETDIVNVERYIRTVAQGSMQVQQVIIDIKPFEQCLYAVLLATDMPDVPLFFLYSVYMIRFTTSGVSPPSSFSFTNMRSPAIPPSGLSVASLPSQWKVALVRPYKPH